MNGVLLITEAFNYAAQRHANQRRKGPSAEPYINHPAEVAAHVSEATDGADHAGIAAALLHDTVEDTGATLEDIARRFGQKVADIVKEVSDDKTLPKEVRKQLQIEHAAHASDSAKRLKMADKISNLNGILRDPPVGWPVERKLEYFHWSKKVVDNCRGASPLLEKRFDEVYQRGIKALQPAA